MDLDRLCKVGAYNIALLEVIPQRARARYTQLTTSTGERFLQPVEIVAMTDAKVLRRIPGIGPTTMRKITRLAYLWDPECRLVRSYIGVKDEDYEREDL